MRKLPILLLALASTSLLSCDGKDAPVGSTGSSDNDRVSIAPRIVRTAAISDELWNSTVIVNAGLYDKDDNLIPGTFISAPYSSRRITLPPIDADQVVSVYVSGQNAAGRKIWYGWTDWYAASDFTAGVGVRSDITIYPSTSQDSLVGTWTYIVDYTGTDDLDYRDVNILVIHPDGTYSINSFTKLASGTLFHYGYLETGTWSSPQHQLAVTPVSYEDCRDFVTGCDVSVIGSSSPLYDVGTAGNARNFSWYISSGSIYMQDLGNSLNSQIWSPYSP